jgi:teichoic acid transport system ATP-binding protein
MIEQVGSSPLSIVADDVDVRYTVFAEPHVSARTAVSRGLKTRRTIQVHAVNHVSFDIHVGEAVGILGSNGSGKSSLLRPIAGLQSFASGSIKVRGEVGLLGVGAALKPSLSGYRNVLLGGLALGMSRDQIEAQMDDIVEFSGLGEAMARPKNTFSSGMRARLAFSISTLRVPDILLIDEALAQLAVGDKDFRAKSLARLDEIRQEAGTIMMITHNLNEIRQSCARAIWLEQGEMLADGDTEEALQRYESK